MRKRFRWKDYKHLTPETPLEMYIAEFLIRSDKFMKIYEKMQPVWMDNSAGLSEARRFYHEIFDRFGVGVQPDESVQLSRLAAPDAFRVLLPSPVAPLRITNDEEVQKELSEKQRQISNEVEKYDDPTKKYQKQIQIGHTSYSGIVPDVSLKKFVGTDKNNLLLMVVNLDRRRDEIKQSIDDICKIHLPKAPGKRWREYISNWKYYLVVYDLYSHFSWSHERIADFLYGHFRQQRNFDEDLSSKYYNKAVRLITVGYKKLI